MELVEDPCRRFMRMLLVSYTAMTLPTGRPAHVPKIPKDYSRDPDQQGVTQGNNAGFYYPKLYYIIISLIRV